MSGANSKAMPGLGDEFRAAREARHLTLSDVSEQIHIRSVYLQSIEAEEWSAIAAPVYVRGFLRTYARFLGLDPEAAVARLAAMLGESGSRIPEPTAVKPIRMRRRSGPSVWLWVAGVVALALVTVVAYKALEFRAAPKEPAVAADSAQAGPVAGTPAPRHDVVPLLVTPPPAKSARTLVVSITSTSWLLVKIDGAQMVEGIYPAGTVKKFHGKSASIRAGNAGGVDLTVNGKNLGPLGASGSVVDKTVQLAEE
jgi:hypothetical protein